MLASEGVEQIDTYFAKYLPQLTALAVMAARELARDKDGGLSNRS